MKITGQFNVHMHPQGTTFEGQDGIAIARMSLEKTYSGELSADSQGEMISAVTAKAGSAGYVAIEQVSGTLSGQAGSFVLQHSGVMNRGEGQLTLVVVPDSGSGELKGISGHMAIRIEEGVHYYDFEYQLS